MNIIGHWINDEVIIKENSRTQAVYHPSTGEIGAQVALADANTTQDAIAAAQEAFATWKTITPMRRARILFKFKELLEQNIDTLAELIGKEHGKILHDAKGEIQRGIEVVEYACGAPELLKGEFTKNVGSEIDSWSDFAPLGVVAGITPFNFPTMVPLWMIPMAIVCGNTFVLKPSEKDPSAALFIAKLLHQAGLPKGVLNVVNGDKEAVDTLLSDSRVQAVSFVGSTPIAEHIYRTASAHGKRCQALGGAKNHAIVMPDADLDNVINSLLGAAFGSSGERCMALSVAVTVGQEMGDKLINGLKKAMQTLKVGAYHDNDNHFGALISQAHKQNVQAHIDSAERQGANIVVDGRNPHVAGYENGFYVGATLIDNVTPDMDSYRAEIFGPVLQVIRVDTIAEALILINQHEYGNGTCIYTQDGGTARYFCDNVQAGMVGVNVPLPVPVAYHSFGGWKRSLFGDLHIYGPDGIRFYTKRKTITQRWIANKESAIFSMPTL
ncbi:methylmalonate-semialdehyde dehydrogenase (CoA acylating) [Moraxella caviae]|uniref:methylmalonate-semialdehyde dehydrogenase (CoA acylating) n=1 Tax=Moraxella caviae TaxID=34060 RepID=A0A1S9ZWI5_9GAMM|nr:CoA-acylating methylmalonate-semialdehyde dehydrogenase [Moraxella caviae]OOR87793.1 methylmalonate-semialdehyde dehydrogenase (CoA acylating) [Moraxella caviae]STZ10549.1 Methylmalonate-semialdehyde dehydrogenase [acylating] [Moraxella caviae]VEW11350.1 Methylmalonate-semialdehyde dehydrogenase [acylating] [Moraxella caviae]